VACEEYLRWTSVNETLTRTCTTGTVLGGQRIEKGEHVMMSWLGANYDPLAFPDPYEVRFDRAATRFYQGNPELHGVVRMPVTFTPGPRAGVERPF